MTENPYQSPQAAHQQSPTRRALLRVLASSVLVGAYHGSWIGALASVVSITIPGALIWLADSMSVEQWVRGVVVIALISALLGMLLGAATGAICGPMIAFWKGRKTRQKAK